MTQQMLLRFLQSSNMFSPQKLEQVAIRFKERTLEKGDFFLRAGQISNEYLVLEKGFIRTFAIDVEGNEVTTNFYSEGNVVFEVSSFFKRTASAESFQAVTDCEGWWLNFEELNDLFHTLPEFREFGRGILVNGFATLKTRVLSMITETAEERYKQLLLSHPEIFQQASLKHIASYLGVTDTSLSRIRKEFSMKVV